MRFVHVGFYLILIAAHYPGAVVCDLSMGGDGCADGPSNTQALLAGYSFVGALLRFRNTALSGPMINPILTYVGGWLDIENTAVTLISMPVRTHANVDCCAIDYLLLRTDSSLQVLTYVGDGMYFNTNTGLANVNIPMLTQIACGGSACGSVTELSMCNNNFAMSAGPFTYSAAIKTAASGLYCNIQVAGVCGSPASC